MEEHNTAVKETDYKDGRTAAETKELTKRERLTSNKCSKRPQGKHKKNGKTVKSHKVIVKIPSATLRREDSGNKLKPTLEQIKEDNEDGKEKVLDENDNEIMPVPHRNKTEQKHSTVQPEVSVPKIQKPQEIAYGLFSRTNTERSLFGTQSDITIPSLSSSATVKPRSSRDFRRPKTVNGWSKKELELFLPRKSFFSVHNNTLSNAGYDIRSDAEKQRPDWRKMLRMHTMEELYPPSKKTEEEEKPKPTFLSFAGDDDSEDEDDEHNLENVQTSLSAEGKEAGPLKRKRQSTKKVLPNDKEEYKPLYDYLKYILDNPEEYIKMSKYSAKNYDYRHPNNLVRLGRAFRRGRQGSVRNNIYIHAIFGLKPKFTDSSTSQKTTRGAENTEPVLNTEEMEIEKLKRKAETWMKDLSTLQFMKAKDMALKDIGEEDVNISKWWSAFRSCSYLRVPRHMTDIHPTTS